MFKKVIPLALMSGLVLAACNNDAVPNNNETPMENRDWTPDMNNNGQTGPNLDGLDNNMNDNRVRDGIINDTNTNGDTTTTPRDNMNNNNGNRNTDMNGNNNR